MRRREFVMLVSGAAAWPLVAPAQQSGMPVIGFLHTASPNTYVSQLSAFREVLKQSGYVEGQNLAIEYRWAEDQISRLPALTAELVQRQVTLIVAGGSPASALAAKSATTTIPIVFMNAADPVAIGLVKSFNRPGGNITGATLLSAELAPKRLGILRDLLPALSKIGLLVNPKRPAVETQIAQVQEAASALGLALHILNASTERELDAAFQAAIQQHDDAVAVAPDAMFLDQRVRIADLAMRYKIPAMYELRNYVDAGGLISYGPSPVDMYRQGATLISEILVGKKAADLPVMQPTKFELAINMKAARTLGLTVSSGLISIADELIE
jgi:putative tryptophan/tyrosine transport system substrate-binding protein